MFKNNKIVYFWWQAACVQEYYKLQINRYEIWSLLWKDLKLLSFYRSLWQHNYILLTVSITFFSIHPVKNISRIWQILSLKVLWQTLNLFLITQTYVSLISYVMFDTSNIRAKLFNITFICSPAQASNIHFWCDLSHWHITVFDSSILTLPNKITLKLSKNIYTGMLHLVPKT